MKLFNKQGAAQGAKREKLRSSFALKRGVYSTAVTAVFIAAVVLLNIFTTSLSARFPLSLDFSSDKINSISEKNAQYLKAVDKPVTIYVCATREEYEQGYLAQYATYYYNVEDSTGKYFAQTPVLLDEYTKHNKNIRVEYVDMSASDNGDIQAVFTEQGVSYGDLLVASSFNVNGNPVTRYKKVAFADIYTLADESGYASMGFGSYTISGSDLETLLTNAIYYATSERIIKLGIPTSHCDVGNIASLSDSLLAGNYEILDLGTSLLTELPEDLDGIIIAAPSKDFGNAELDAIAKFLDNEGKRGKTLLYFASHTSPALPNLEAFLAEWGITYSDGMLYETNANYAMPDDATFIALANAATDYTAGVNGSNLGYLAQANLPMAQGFETYGSRTTQVILTTSNSVVVRPENAADGWKPDASAAKSYPAAIVCADKNELVTSYVAAFANVSFVNNQYVSNATIGNLDFAVALLNACFDAGDSVSFVSKTITTDSFAESVTEASAKTVRTVFVVVLPLALIAAGVVVWIRRRSR